MSSEKPNEVTTNINLPFPDAADKHLKIQVGACRLKANPTGEAWLSGTYADGGTGVVVGFDTQGGLGRLWQDYKAFYPFAWFSNAPQFDLALGKAAPYMLTIEMGASDNAFDLGGLPLTRLSIKQGAGKAEVNFSAPNPQPMSLINIEAGALSLEMYNLANANFAEMKVDGGAAGYKFDFGGTLQRDAHVKITTGMSGVELIIPATTAAKISAETMLGGVNMSDGFTKKDGAFWTQAAINGGTPILTIDANVSLGGLTLKVK